VQSHAKDFDLASIGILYLYSNTVVLDDNIIAVQYNSTPTTIRTGPSKKLFFAVYKRVENYSTSRFDERDISTNYYSSSYCCMGRQSRRSRSVAVQNRRVSTGKFGKREDSEQSSDDDDLPRYPAMSNGPSRVSKSAWTGKRSGLSKVVCSGWWLPRLQSINTSSKRRKIQETLDAVPIWTIDSYFVNAHHDDDNPAHAAATASPNAARMSFKAAKHERMKTCYKLINEILNGSNSNFSCRSMVQYLTIQKCLRLQIDGMGKI
jgi:hypothetical protein